MKTKSTILTFVLGVGMLSASTAATLISFDFTSPDSINGDETLGSSFKTTMDGETSATVFDLSALLEGLTLTVTPSQSDISITDTGLGIGSGGTLADAGDALTFSFNRDISFDFLDVGGFTPGGNDSVIVSYSNSNPSVTLDAGDFDNNTSDTITFSSENSLLAGESFTLARNDGDFSIEGFNVSVVPEPQLYGALAGLLALGLTVIRRRRD
ncbi:hypothetical protein [Puniceicoccus vermicola]|uniref:PEP-CTERM sorting domain-containing protein n=1 Tax=Puniceicoccus vermicola TaxID=388746 RepID=A0A7X1AVD0_9BACT|nr:hypothetical protein [Puniceicoccus vermicola]MBC2600701.1 hypothetical protein [Puniceicoccus vermicola]